MGSRRGSDPSDPPNPRPDDVLLDGPGHTLAQNRNFGEVVFRQLHLAVEDGLPSVRLPASAACGRGAVALQAEGVRRFGPQQVLVIVAVRIVASGAALLERG